MEEEQRGIHPGCSIVLLFLGFCLIGLVVLVGLGASFVKDVQHEMKLLDAENEYDGHRTKGDRLRWAVYYEDGKVEGETNTIAVDVRKHPKGIIVACEHGTMERVRIDQAWDGFYFGEVFFTVVPIGVER